jgi:hypothetical protein
MSGPIKPSEVAFAKVNTFPDAVWDSFNELITQNYSDGSAIVEQADVVKLMVEMGLDREDINSKGWLNVEDAYEKAGWKVEYDKPGYNESYPATFTFTKKGR